MEKLTADAEIWMKDLEDLLGTDRKDIFNHALTLFEDAALKAKAGNRIAYVDAEDNVVEIVTVPLLQKLIEPSKG